MSISIGGCAIVTVKKYYTTAFAVGSLVYFVPKAKKGILYPVAIKKIEAIFQSAALPTMLYTDTLNALYNEDELCGEAEAIQYALAFYEAQQAELDRLVRKSQCVR